MIVPAVKEGLAVGIVVVSVGAGVLGTYVMLPVVGPMSAVAVGTVCAVAGLVASIGFFREMPLRNILLSSAVAYGCTTFVLKQLGYQISYNQPLLAVGGGIIPVVATLAFGILAIDRLARCFG